MFVKHRIISLQMSRKWCTRKSADQWSDDEIREALDFGSPCMSDVPLETAKHLMIFFRNCPEKVYKFMELDYGFEDNELIYAETQYSGEAPDDYDKDSCKCESAMTTDGVFVR